MFSPLRFNCKAVIGRVFFALAGFRKLVIHRYFDADSSWDKVKKFLIFEFRFLIGSQRSLIRDLRTCNPEYEYEWE